MTGDECGRAILVLAVVATVAFTAVAAGPAAATGIDASAGNAPADGTSVEALTDCREINESGAYELTRNITLPADQNCIFINVDNVSFDGNGHTIRGEYVERPHAHPIAVHGGDSPNGYSTIETPTNVTIENVRLQNWWQGVRMRNVANVTVANMTFRNTSYLGGTAGEDGLAIYRGSNVTVRDSSFNETAGPGVSISQVTDARVLNTTVRNTGSAGLSLANTPDAIVRDNRILNAGNYWSSTLRIRGHAGNVTVVDNTVRGGGGTGIGFKAHHGLVRNNTVVDKKHGIAVTGGRSVNNTIIGNTVRDSNRNGIQVRDASNTSVVDNTVTGGDMNGIYLRTAREIVASENTVSANSNGITVIASTNITVERNRVTDHPGTYRDGNGLKIRRGSKRVRVAANVLRNNTDGVRLRGGQGTTTVVRNRIVDNRHAGIELTYNVDAEFQEIDGNVIASNGQFGIESDADSADLDATGNWWGSAGGPGSPDSDPLADPTTGTLADGAGNNVSENESDAGVSNVRFDPWLETEPTLGIGDLGIVTADLPTGAVDRRIRDHIAASGGTPPITDYEVVNGSLPPGTTLHDNGTLVGTTTSAGNYTFTVAVTDSANETATATFTKDVRATVPRASIDIEKVGTGATPGRTTLYLIRVENIGDTVARDVPVNEYLEPWWAYRAATPTPENVTSTVIRNGTSEYVESLVETNGSDLNFTQDITQTTLSWTVDELRPGESRLLTYQVRLDSRIPDGFTVRGEACSCTGGCCENYKRCKEEVVAGCKFPGNLGRGSTLFDCITLDTAGCAYGLWGPDPEELCNELGDKAICERDFEACRAYNELKPREPPCDEDEQNATTPTDPNEKVVGAERYIRPNRTLPYVVHYENVGDATATNVTVTDRIPDELDLSTVTVFTANRTRVGVDETTPVTLLRRNVTRTRNVTIGNRTVTRTETVQERHTAELDGRTLRWDLENTDLPPNGTGTLLMEATPKQGLADGTRIENNATIEFDEVSSLTTNNTVNVIDTVAPSCTVDPLPERSGRDIRVSWSGSDPVGEIEEVTIYVSTDGETWEIAEVGVENETVSYDGEVGETYRFMCVAEDTAGNTESQSPQPEARTSVTAVDVSGRVYEADGDPATDDTVAIGDGDPSTAPVVVNDWNGTTCRLLQFDSAVSTDRTGRFDYVTDVGGTESLSYYQAPLSAFPQGNGSMADGEVTFPRDGSPDLYGLDRFGADGDRDLGTVTLPPAHPLNVTVVTEDGVPVDNATVKVEHTGVNDSTAAVIFPRATDGDGLLVPDRSDAPGVEVTGSVSVTVSVPNETRLVQRLYTRNLTVESARNLTVEVNVTERLDEEPPVIERFEHSRATEPISEANPTTITVGLSDENPANATLAVRANASDETVFERDVSAAFADPVSVAWNGTNATGAPVDAGEYDLVLTATDANGNEATDSLSAVVAGQSEESEESEEDEESEEGEEDEESEEGEEDEESEEGEEDEEDEESEDENDEAGNGGSNGSSGGSSGGSAGGGSGVGSGNLVSPDITVDAAVGSRLVAVGEPLTVTATVRNGGSATGEFDLALSLDGVATGVNRTGELAPGDETTVQFQYNLTEPGVYDLRIGETGLGSVTVLDGAAESVSTARLDGDTAAFDDGPVERVSISGQSGVVSVARLSGLPAVAPSLDGTLFAAVEIGLPDADATASVRVGVARAELTDAGVAPGDVRVLRYGPGSGEWESLSVRVVQQSETRVTFAVDGAASTLAVVGPAETEPTPTDAASPTTERTPAPVTAADPAADPAPDPGTTEPATTTGQSGPGFGLTAVLVALVLFVAVAARRLTLHE
ncbi:right-handed parallel beta-helix repeat-containing protein [Halorientalis pallida]|uniref:right-handed parallel beta-helix repeat-containing protein n=1 Tax=Halorientalis pallida TaxID=2479928 RepID=UPI003C6FEC0C